MPTRLRVGIGDLLAWSPTGSIRETSVAGATTTCAGPAFQRCTGVRFESDGAMPSVDVALD